MNIDKRWIAGVVLVLAIAVPGFGPPIGGWEKVSVGPKLQVPVAGAVADGPPPAKARLCAAKIGSGRKSLIS